MKQMSTFNHLKKKGHSMLASKSSTGYHIASQILGKKRHKLKQR
jgi:hypothetical protein